MNRSAEELGHAVEEGVATVLSRIAQEIRGSAPPAPPEDAPRGRRIAPLDADEAGVDDAESEALGAEEADRAARRGRGGGR
ncbi:hypothetical protein WMF20_16450 [Sorangium sp. So ce834]|uniref:hypothetical protein n=1 Tax=Sorangium sp. So ce834 TaxID=3133321 RepID=UPI003F63C485